MTVYIFFNNQNGLHQPMSFIGSTLPSIPNGTKIELNLNVIVHYAEVKM